MCVLPKATFYLYFAFFFVGYIWVFMIFFYNTWEDGVRKQDVLKRPPQQQQQQQPLHQALPPVNSVPFYDLQQELPPETLKELSPDCLILLQPRGLKFCAHSPTADRQMSAYVNQHKIWESDLTREITAVIRFDAAAAIFVDAGAGLGYFSLLAASLGADVLAFEPFRDNLIRFQLSARQNRLLDRITVIASAVTDSAKNLSVRETGEEGERRESAVPGLPLDSLLPVARDMADRKPGGAGHARLLLRLGTPGHECYAVRGAEKFLQQLPVSVIFTKFEPASQVEEQRMRCLEDMKAILRYNSFLPYQLRGRQLEKMGDFSLANVPQTVVWQRVKEDA